MRDDFSKTQHGNMIRKKYELLMSDERYGHPELGWISRLEDPETEDASFKKMLRSKGFISPAVRDGIAWVSVPTGD